MSSRKVKKGVAPAPVEQEQKPVGTPGNESQKAAAAPAEERPEVPAAVQVAAAGLPPVLRTVTREKDGALMEFRTCPGCGKEHKGLGAWFAQKAGQAAEEKGYSEPFLCNGCAKARRKAAEAPVAGEKAEAKGEGQAPKPAAKAVEKGSSPKGVSRLEQLRAQAAEAVKGQTPEEDENLRRYQAECLGASGVLGPVERLLGAPEMGVAGELASAGHSLYATLRALEATRAELEKSREALASDEATLAKLQREGKETPEFRKEFFKELLVEKKRLQAEEQAANETQDFAVLRFIGTCEEGLQALSVLAKLSTESFGEDMKAHVQEKRNALLGALRQRVQEARKANRKDSPIFRLQRLEKGLLAAAASSRPATPAQKPAEKSGAKSSEKSDDFVKGFLAGQREQGLVQEAASVSGNGIMAQAFKGAGVRVPVPEPVQSEEGKVTPATDPSKGKGVVAEAPKAKATSPKAEAKPRKAAKPKASSAKVAKTETEEGTKKTRRGSRGK